MQHTGISYYITIGMCIKISAELKNIWNLYFSFVIAQPARLSREEWT